jgi:hypothetical protein
VSPSNEPFDGGRIHELMKFNYLVRARRDHIDNFRAEQFARRIEDGGELVPISMLTLGEFSRMADTSSPRGAAPSPGSNRSDTAVMDDRAASVPRARTLGLQRRAWARTTARLHQRNLAAEDLHFNIEQPPTFP